MGEQKRNVILLGNDQLVNYDLMLSLMLTTVPDNLLQGLGGTFGY